MTWGSGARNGSFNPKYERISPKSVFSAYSDGTLTLSFGWLRDDEDRLPPAIEKLALLVGNLDGFELPKNFREIGVSFPAEVWAPRVEELTGAFREALGD